ncbi:sensor histidine kinase [Cohnella zeiphila]|uniref:histidine kinase n=1 Tax=Cohnella zeiphila TaxID=2761120 RepID=A0A7X0SNE0_9BACL|nr:HAMP domain-containing sensor histidine kinase [Cohnella zeiphila]MBB6733031.1 HAMP domain-containing protein [Cohnella zeiphila]
MKRRTVKFRTYLLLANAFSLAAILAVLFYCYSHMLLKASAFAWLGGATVAAGALSFLLHVMLTHPLERAIARIGEASAQIASGSLGTEVPIVGPAEFRLLAEQFNAMSRQLKESFDRIARSEAARGELVANVAHDLRTPLALLQSHSEALLDGIVEEEETVRSYLNVIRKETVRLGELVKDLFDLSRLDAGAESFEARAVPLEDVLVDTLNAYRLKLENKRLEVSVQLPEASPIVLGVESELRRIVGNLLDNGIRHSPIGGRLVWSVEPEGETAVAVTLRDEGEGIPEAERERIFERFYRSDSARRRDEGGAGLGLAIAKSLVGRHGGTIGVASRPGEGSEFRFTLRTASGKAR